MKKFALISFFAALCLECVAMVPHSVKAAKGWLFYESGAVSAPVVCRVEAEVPSSAAGHIVLENGDSYIKLKFGKVKAERHVLTLKPCRTTAMKINSSYHYSTMDRWWESLSLAESRPEVGKSMSLERSIR